MATMDDMYDMYKLLEYLDRPVTRRLQHKEFDVGRERMPDGAPGLVLQMTATASAADKEKGGEISVSKIEDYDPGHDRSSSQAISSSASATLPASPAEEQSDSARMAHYSPSDPDNPYNWSSRRKAFVVFAVITFVFNGSMGSSLASNLTPALSKLYHIDSDAVLLLPTSIFLVGYVVGPLVWGPLSEHSGRRPVLLGAFALFLAATLGCAVVPTYAALNVLRFFAGAAASCPITVCGGVCADLYRDSRARGRAMAIFMCFSMSGPSMAPALAGFVVAAGGWRLVFWISLALAVTSAAPLALLPETYGPVLLARRVRRARRKEAEAAKAAGESAEAVAAIANGPARAGPDGGLRHVLTVVLMRPLRMLATEPLVLFSCMYLSFAYSIFYMFLPAFPMVFQTDYGFSLGEEGLAFLGFGAGSVLAVAAYYAWDAVVARAQRQGKRWAHGPEGIRLPLACAGGPLVVVACFWLGWTARSDIPWAVPVLAMVPFGIGFLLLFMALLNYLVDAYKIFAASAIAAAGTTRSVCGAALPFAAQPMYARLGVPWACSLLGFLSLGLAVIPFVFMWKGEELRLRSNFCRHLRDYELQEEEEKRMVQPATDTAV